MDKHSQASTIPFADTDEEDQPFTDEDAENAWGEAEMRALLSHVRRYGHSHWDQLAETIPNKSADACRLKANRESMKDPSLWAEGGGGGGGARMDRIVEGLMTILDDCFDEVADRVVDRIADRIGDRVAERVAERLRREWRIQISLHLHSL